MDFRQGDIGFAYIERIGVETGDPSPVFPEGVVVWYIATPSPKSSWAIYGFRVIDEAAYQQTSLLLDPVDEELSLLLDSAREYPPALALARDVLENCFEEVPDKGEYGRLFGEELRHHLTDLASPFFLAEVVVDSEDLLQGAFYWVVGYEAAERQLQVVTRAGWVENFDPLLFGFTHEFLRFRFGF